MKPAEVQWRLMRAERRALDGPEFKSPAVRLARALWQMRQFQMDEKAQRKRKRGRRIYSYAIEHCKKRIESLLPLVPIGDLTKALSDLDGAEYSDSQRQVLNACWAIFNRTRSFEDPEHAEAIFSAEGIQSEIKAALKDKHKKCVPSLGTIYNVINRLEVPTRRGKRGPVRGSRHKKLPRKRG